MKQHVSSMHVADQSMKNGLRVKFLVTLSAGATAAPLFVMISGLTDTEMPSYKYPDGYKCFKIQGLAPCGTVDIYNNSHGYLCFCRKSLGEGVDHAAKRMSSYFVTVFWPYVEMLRQRKGWDGTHPIPDEYTAVRWCDGAHEQVRAITMEGSLEIDYDQLQQFKNKKRKGKIGSSK
jgi:hypothetical protein